jgi:L-rhamnose isomerase
LPIGQVASRHYLRFELTKRPELLTCLNGWLQALGVDVQRLAHVQHPQDGMQGAVVMLTQCLTGDVLLGAMEALRQMSGGLEPAAMWRVEDLN